MKYLFSARFRDEARANLRLALPLMAAQISFVSMGTVDTIMAGRLGEVPLAAVAVGANAFFVLFVVFMGLFMAVSPIIAQRVGAGRDAQETGQFVRGALALAVVCGVVWMMLLAVSVKPVLGLLGLEPQTRALAQKYLYIMTLAALPLCLTFVLRNTAEGHGQTRVPLIVGLVGLCFNLLGNYTFMYGHFGFPALGAIGSAWGSLLATLAMTLAYFLLFSWDPPLAQLRLFRRGLPLPRHENLEILQLGASISAIVVAESWLFSVGSLMIARFGAEAVAAHQIAINFTSLCFMVPLSIGMATTVRVGQAAGAGSPAGAAARGRAGMVLGALFASCSATMMLLLPRPIIALYTGAEAVTTLAVRFLALAALFQLFDCVQATANGALRGIKDTGVPMLVTISAYWLLGMPFAAWLVYGTAMGPAGLWCGFILGLGVASVGLCYRILRHPQAGLRSDVPTHSVLMP